MMLDINDPEFRRAISLSKQILALSAEHNDSARVVVFACQMTSAAMAKEAKIDPGKIETLREAIETIFAQSRVVFS